MAFLKKYHFLAAFFILFLFLLHCSSLIDLWSSTPEELEALSRGLALWQGGLEAVDGFPLLEAFLASPYALGFEDFSLFDYGPPETARSLSLFCSLLLLTLIYREATESAGPSAGLLVLLLLCLSPNIAAHSALATLDILGVLLAILFLLVLKKALDGSSMKHFALAALILALILSEFYFGLPLFLLPLLGLFLLYSRRSEKRPIGGVILLYCLASLLCLSVFGWPSYFSDLPSNEQLDPYIAGYRGYWARIFYYPAVFLLKTPGGSLLLLVLIFFFLYRDRDCSLYSLAFAIILLFFFLFSSPGLAYRHIIVLHPLLLLAFASLIQRALVPGFHLAILSLLILSLNGAAFFSAMPHHLSYVNGLGHWLSGGPFPLAGEDLDRGQDEYILARRLASLPKDSLKYINPHPSTVPLEGFIAVSANNYLTSLGGDLPAYDWLQLFRAKSVIGGTWLLFDLKENDYYEMAKDLKDRNAQLNLLRFLLARGAFDQLLKLCPILAEHHAVAHRFLALASLGLGRYDDALSAWDDYEESLEEKASDDFVFLRVARNLAALEEGSEEHRSARAIRLMLCSRSSLYEPIIEVMKERYRLAARKESGKLGLEAKQVWALEYFERGEFSKAMELFESLKGNMIHRHVLSLLRHCETIMELREEETIESKVKLGFLLTRLGHGGAGMLLLREAYEEQPWNATVRHFCLRCIIRRRGIVKAYRTGESMLFDCIDPITQRWERPKKGSGRVSP